MRIGFHVGRQGPGRKLWPVWLWGFGFVLLGLLLLFGPSASGGGIFIAIGAAILGVAYLLESNDRKSQQQQSTYKSSAIRDDELLQRRIALQMERSILIDKLDLEALEAAYLARDLKTLDEARDVVYQLRENAKRSMDAETPSLWPPAMVVANREADQAFGDSYSALLHLLEMPTAEASAKRGRAFGEMREEHARLAEVSIAAEMKREVMRQNAP